MKENGTIDGSAEAGDRSAESVLGIAAQLLAEMYPSRSGVVQVRLDSLLDRDLGLDSLGRVELQSRIERAFDTALPEHLSANAETLRDLLDALRSVRGGVKTPVAAGERQQAPEAAAIELSGADTLTEVLERHCRAHPERSHIIFYADGGEDGRISYADLKRGAGKIACGLLGLGLEPRRSVAVMLPTGPDYFYSFFGIMMAGGVPVPVYPPARLSQIEDHLKRHAGIMENARVRILITVPEARPLAWLLKSATPGLRSIVTPRELATSCSTLPHAQANANDTAFLQYTSGSTGNPKGVILTHANLLANIRAMGQVTGISSTDVFVSWLPLYHDMGLIGAWLGSLCFAAPLMIMSPLAFLSRPERWLHAIHRYRGTLSAAPNFAYELCLKKIGDRDIEGVDLGSWRMACNGAEPVSAAAMEAFCERFAPYGFRPEAVAPVYGLAESSVGLAFPPPGRGLKVDLVRRADFMATGRAVPAEASDGEALRFVASGFPLPGHQTRIVDRMGHELPERMEGRLEFCGPSATAGYFSNPEETARLLHDDWLDSGDLAYQAEGELYITGRSKDIIIKAGRNIYPYELEEAIGALPGIRRGCVAVFGSSDPASGTERLIVLAETRESAPERLEALRSMISDLALELLEAPPDDIVLAQPHTVLKTSSGKIRRAASRQFYEGGRRAARPAPVWLQITRLAWSGTVAQGRSIIAMLLTILYAAYVWSVVALIAPPAWLAASLMPHQAGSWLVSRLAARILLRLAGITVHIEGAENIPAKGRCILAANHSSYLDGLVLIAALPRRGRFVAKRELKESFFSRLYLQGIGCEFVERFDAQQSVEDSGRLESAVMSDPPLIFFPEGTFCRKPGLLPFKMGAFLAAARTATPVVPLAIRGTRSILHPDHWFPHRGSISIVAGGALSDAAADWDAALRLKDLVRAEILRHCGEPDLADG